MWWHRTSVAGWAIWYDIYVYICVSVCLLLWPGITYSMILHLNGFAIIFSMHDSSSTSNFQYFIEQLSILRVHKNHFLAFIAYLFEIDTKSSIFLWMHKLNCASLSSWILDKTEWIFGFFLLLLLSFGIFRVCANKWGAFKMLRYTRLIQLS